MRSSSIAKKTKFVPKSGQRASKSINMPHLGLVSPAPHNFMGLSLRNATANDLDKDIADPNSNVLVNQFNSQYHQNISLRCRTGQASPALANSALGMMGTASKEKSPAFGERQRIKNYKNARLMRQQ